MPKRRLAFWAFMGLLLIQLVFREFAAPGRLGRATIKRATQDYPHARLVACPSLKSQVGTEWLRELAKKSEGRILVTEAPATVACENCYELCIDVISRSPIHATVEVRTSDGIDNTRETRLFLFVVWWWLQISQSDNVVS